MESILVNQFYNISTGKVEDVTDDGRYIGASYIGTQPAPSDQGSEKVCGPHATSKAVESICDSVGYDCDVLQVQNCLIRAAQPDTKARNQGLKTLSVFNKVVFITSM